MTPSLGYENITEEKADVERLKIGRKFEMLPLGHDLDIANMFSQHLHLCSLDLHKAELGNSHTDMGDS